MSMNVDLILNLAMLIAISVVSGFVAQRWPRQSRLGVSMQGLLFGAAAVLGMLRPALSVPGLIFDGRSVVISLCGLFFGPAAAAVAVATAGSARVWIGGDGMLTGVLVIISSGVIGVLAHLRRRAVADPPSATELYLFGVVVHVIMLLMMLTLPGETRAVVLGRLSVPILLMFPIATILAGTILADQEARVRFVDALQRARKDLDVTLRSIGDAVASTDAEGRIVRMNPAAEELTGWQEAEAHGRPIGEVFRIAGDDGRDAGDIVRRVLHDPHVTGLTGHMVLTSRDGTTKPVADCAAPMRNDDGTISGVVLVFSDQTVQWAAQQALKDAQEQLQRAVRAGGVGLWDWDLRTNRVYYSPEWKRLAGYEDHEISNDPAEWETRLHPDERDRVVRHVQDFIRGAAAAVDHEFRFRHKDGTYRHILARWAKVHDESGTPVRVVGSYVDITARVELQAQLLQAQKMETVGQLAGGIAHDFNNLLTVINGMTDLALAGLRPDNPLRADLEQIRQAGDRAASLTRQLLAFSRKQILAPAVLRLGSLVSGMESMLLRLLGENIRLVVPPSASTWTVRADPGQVEQVIMNLAVNARDAMPGGGTLTIETADVVVEAPAAGGASSLPPGEYVMLAVSDTGTGMSEAVAARIFEPFFTTKEAGQGTGLGLSTVYGIVNQSGGSIDVRTAPGGGTTFRIHLPRTRDASEAPRPAAAALQGGAERILVVEDEEALRHLAARILSSAGYTVYSARNGAEALQLLVREAGAIDLVLTDVMLPGMGGPELASRIAEAYPGIRIIYTSGFTDDPRVRDGLDAQARPFISKPYTRAELTRRVRELLDTPG